MSKGITSLVAVLLAAGMMCNAWATQNVVSIVPIYKTNMPQYQLGFDVSRDQTVGVRFSPIDDVTLSTVELWFMNNSYMTQGEVTVTLRDDKKHKDGLTKPGNKILESWTFQVSSLGWQIAQEILVSKVRPQLKHDQRYWLVAESSAPALENPVWSIAQSEGGNIGLGYGGSFSPKTDEWTSLGYSSIPNVHVFGELPLNNP